MERKAEDYYDIPYELLPTPNFAGRPSCEISDINLLDGLWTSPDFSHSFFDTDDDVNSTGIALGPAAPPLSHTRTKSETPKGPEIKVTAPSSDRAQRHVRNWSDLGPTTEILRLQKKAFTAPPGAICQSDFAPQLPRRALSAGLGRSKAVKGRGECRKGDAEDLLAIKSALKGARPEPQRPLPRLPDGNEYGITVRAGALQSSSLISEKERTRRMLRHKNLTKLDTSFLIGDAERIESPTSMMNTPRELYGVSEVQTTRITSSCLRSKNVSSTRSSPEKSLLPQQPTSSKPLSLEALQREDNGASTCTGEQSKLYLPGPVILEKHPALPRNDSVTTMDLFDSGLEPKTKRFSDLIIVDAIVSFFADLGVIEESPDDSLDKYWLDKEPKRRASAWLERTSVVSIVEPTPRSPLSPLSLQSARSGCHSTAITRTPSKFSFSSASSNASLPRFATPMGKRLKWIRLLTPGIPGSAFLKSAGN